MIKKLQKDDIKVICFNTYIQPWISLFGPLYFLIFSANLISLLLGIGC